MSIVQPTTSHVDQPATSGIYLIRCTENGVVYIGSAANFAKREYAHRFALKNGVHHSQRFQRTWDKYGESAFVWSILEVVPLDGLPDKEARCVLIAREQHHLDTWDGPLFNTSPTAGSPLGVRFTDEQKANAKAAAQKKGQDPTFRAKVAAAAQRRAQDPEWLAKNAEAVRLTTQGKKWQESHAAAMKALGQDPGFRAKMSKAAQQRRDNPEAVAKHAEGIRRRTQDPTWRANRAAAAKRLAQDPAWQAQLAEHNRQKARDPEYRQRLAAACQAPERKAKIGAAHKALWADPEYRAKMMAKRRDPAVLARLAECARKQPRKGRYWIKPDQDNQPTKLVQLTLFDD